MTLRRAFPILPCILLVLMWLGVPAASGSTEHQIDLKMEQFAFAPYRLHVQKGDRVVITLHSQDVTHGFYLDGYNLQHRVEPGIPQRIEFVADRPGKFRYRCSVSCGSLHPFMIGELVVESNTPYTGAVGLTVLLMVSMISYLWISKGNTDEQATA